MASYVRMDQLLKTRSEFWDYMSQQQRTKELQLYDSRIAALQNAKATLASTPVFRLTRKEIRNAESFCKQNGWTDEDAALLVEDFLKRRPATMASKMPLQGVASGISRIGSAVMLA